MTGGPHWHRERLLAWGVGGDPEVRLGKGPLPAPVFTSRRSWSCFLFAAEMMWMDP